MTRNLDRYQQEYDAMPFEETMAKARKRVILEFLRQHQCRDILEVGCAGKPLVKDLGVDDFRSCVVLEPGRAYFEQAQVAVQMHTARERIQLYQQPFEEFSGNVPVDCIIISSLLHELSTPAAMLQHAFSIAPKGCWIHVDVPNAKSFHRLWAAESGLIKTEYEKSATQVRLQQSHTFDSESLDRLVTEAGFTVIESGSYFIKPFTHAQMQQLMDMGLLTEELLLGLTKMERHLPGLGAEIFVHARKA